MNADPRWLEILKATGWQTTALAVASAVIAILVGKRVIPTDNNPYWFTVPVAAAIVLWCLSLAAMASALTRVADPAARLARWRHLRRAKRAAREYIPHMTAVEKKIIGYLLHHNQKVFQTEQDAGYAAPLVSKGIIVVAVRPGQVVSGSRVPFEIPDYVWSVLQSHKAQFPYDPPKAGDREPYPWAIPWSAR
jgi:hypothetical protein